ncbi:MAG: glycosyltransferase family 2 protein [Xanthobacteraceae bacterium]
MSERISVVVATYNRPDALDACLRSLSVQSDDNFEIIVADDGSGTATAAVINDWSRRLGVTLKHAWHPDRGFRLAEIRNRAIRICDGTYCIFLDGDCIARPDFVSAHRRLMEAGWFVTGNRVLLSASLTERILQFGVQPEFWSIGQWMPRRLSGDVNRVAPLLSLSIDKLRKYTASRWRGARGSNMAFWRSDLLAVDGFDSAYTGWGREDSDIFIRMVRAGIHRKDGRFATAVLHLWHEEADRKRLSANDRQLDELLASDRTRALQGLSHVVAEIEHGRADFAGARQAS